MVVINIFQEVFPLIETFDIFNHLCLLILGKKSVQILPAYYGSLNSLFPANSNKITFNWAKFKICRAPLFQIKQTKNKDRLPIGRHFRLLFITHQPWSWEYCIKDCIYLSIDNFLEFFCKNGRFQNLERANSAASERRSRDFCFNHYCSGKF